MHKRCRNAHAQNMTRKLLAAYILLTHGPRPGPALGSHPAARQQLRNLKAVLADQGLSETAVIYDYARSWSGLADLPALLEALEACKTSEDQPVLLMDDLNRLFRHSKPERRVDMLNEVQSYNEHLFGIRQGMVLARCSDSEARRVVFGYGSARFIYSGQAYRRPRSAAAKREQTRAATVASSARRAEAADAASRAVAKVRDELTSASAKVTLQNVADEANRRGLRTTGGGSWSVSTVSRALTRAEQSAGEDT